MSSTFSIALRALSANKGRTFLTSLGITIGIAAVIAMVSAGQGAQSKLDDAFGVIGPNLVVGFSGTKTKSGISVNAGEGAFTQDDAAALRSELRSLIVGCSEVSQMPCIASSNTGSYGTALVGGVPEVFQIRRWKLKYGASYNDEQVKRQEKVAVLGATVARKLFPGVNPVGKTIRINNPTGSSASAFRVIGVLEPKGPTLIGGDQDDIVMTPMSTLLRKVMGTD
jgi:putative ABC transport system permease protein